MQVRITKEKAIEILKEQQRNVNARIQESLITGQLLLNEWRQKMEALLALPDEELQAQHMPPCIPQAPYIHFEKQHLVNLNKKLVLLSKTTRPTVIFTEQDMPEVKVPQMVEYIAQEED